MAYRPLIFVGSASESKALATRICEALANNDFTPIPWWESFDLGDVTIQALMKQTLACDGAVFLFTSDDDITSRGKDAPITRDNVILEYGLFASRLGTKKTIAFLENGVKNPTDFVGLTQEVFNPDFPNFDRLVEHFKRIFLQGKRDSQNSHAPLIVDENLTQTLLENQAFPKAWRQRLLYIGVQGAKNWMSVSQDANYTVSTVAQKTKSALQDAVSAVGGVANFVSFGPGDGILDEELLVSLSNQHGMMNYIPVDINFYFANQAASKMPSGINVPFGLVVDFEDSLEFILKEVTAFSSRPKLYSLLGYTLSNLDRNEERFLTRLRDGLESQDCILMDISTAGPNWSAEQERVMKPSGYSEAYKQFFSMAIVRRFGESLPEVLRDFDTRFSCQLLDASDVPNSKVLIVRDEKHNYDVFKFTRYDLDALKKWITEYLRMEVLFSADIARDGVADFGILLIRKASQ